jgi:hypothetical protein
MLRGIELADAPADEEDTPIFQKIRVLLEWTNTPPARKSGIAFRLAQFSITPLLWTLHLSGMPVGRR